MAERMTPYINALHDEIIKLIAARVEEWQAAGIPDKNIKPALLTLGTHLCGAIFARVASADPDPPSFLYGAAQMIAEQSIGRALAEIYQPERKLDA